MLKIPTVNDWLALARRFPQYKRPSTSILKDYGVMACMDFVETTFHGRGKDVRILEFGHGFNPAIIERFQHTHEVWGADRDQKLVYFRNIDWEQDFQAKVAPRCPDVHFVRHLLSSMTPDDIIPDNYFDCIASVSVLEEVSIETVEDILSAAARKLRPGGYLIGTHDLNFRRAASRIPQYLKAHRKAGLAIDDIPTPIKMDWLQTLLENPISVILHYQQGEPEESRSFWGHFGTLFTVARKANVADVGQADL